MLTTTMTGMKAKCLTKRRFAAGRVSVVSGSD